MPEIDARAARRRFGRAAATYADAARLEGEVGARMLERLEVVRVAPARILDAGCGPAPQARALARRYPGAALVALDFSLPMLALARRALGWRARLRGARMLAVCGALERLPLAAGSIGLAWSNMALHWAADTHAALAELGRVLVPGGLLMFSTLGPDTLKELRAAVGEARVHRFADMHDIGDALVAAGFAAPVMDMEMLTLQYPDPAGLAADLRASGQTLALRARARGLAGRGLRARLAAAGASASIEVIYGHAWKGMPRKTADGRGIVHFERRPLP
ncbi:MAG TPA: methyltransferase domain-containing protein [Burkholderiales bacterium]|nr:methyltransferase domain-containing protein [Burkholderiales bacterium]